MGVPTSDQSDSDTKKCPRCGNRIRIQARVCRHCRAEFELSRLGYCQACHLVITATEEDTCSTCGGPLTDMHVDSSLRQPAPEPSPPDSTTVAPPPPPAPPKGRTLAPITVRMRRGFAAAALAFTALALWTAFLPWLDPIYGETTSGWDLFNTAGQRGVNQLLASDLYWWGSGPAFTGLAAVISALALGVVALAVLLWPAGEAPATGKIPVWLRVLVAATTVAAIPLPIVNLTTFTFSRQEFRFIRLGYGMALWIMAAYLASASLAISAAPHLRRRPALPAGAPMRRGARIALQTTITILLLIGFFVAVGLPCGLEETEAARDACFGTTAAKVYAGIGVGGAALGLLLTWAGPPILRRRNTRRVP